MLSIDLLRVVDALAASKTASIYIPNPELNITHHYLRVYYQELPKVVLNTWCQLGRVARSTGPHNDNHHTRW